MEEEGVPFESDEIIELAPMNEQLYQYRSPPSTTYFNCKKNLTTMPTFEHYIKRLYITDTQITEIPSLHEGIESIHISKSPLTIFHSFPLSLRDLDLFDCNLTMLPELPMHLAKLQCSHNLLTTLPNLPESLELLDCMSNQIKQLPRLPSKLHNLYCSYNQLTELPALPESIIALACKSNSMTAIPYLPEGMNYIEFDDHLYPFNLLTDDEECMYSYCDVVEDHNHHYCCESFEEIHATCIQKMVTMKRIQDRCQIVKEEIMMKAWCPARVEKLLNMGYDVEDM